MQIKEITVSAGRTLPHPIQSYANLRSQVTLRAELAEGDDPLVATKQLQVQAERLVEEHSAVLVSSIEDREVSRREREQIQRLEHSISTGQQQLSELRERQAARETADDLPLFGEAATDYEREGDY